jgi:hypothetical protein
MHIKSRYLRPDAWNMEPSEYCPRSIIRKLRAELHDFLEVFQARERFETRNQRPKKPKYRIEVNHVIWGWDFAQIAKRSNRIIEVIRSLRELIRIEKNIGECLSKLG